MIPVVWHYGDGSTNSIFVFAVSIHYPPGILDSWEFNETSLYSGISSRGYVCLICSALKRYRQQEEGGTS